MKGPTLYGKSSVPSEPDTEPPISPEEMIDNFTREILTAIPDDEIERHEDNGSWDAVNCAAEVVALHLARSWHFESPWWADEALRRLFADGLPTTGATENVHAHAADLRLAGGGQQQNDFRRQYWEDFAFFQVATMRQAGISGAEAAQHGARWRDEFGDGEFTVKASTIESGYPKWASDPLRGKVWCEQLSWVMSKLTDAEKTNLVQSNKLRTELLPPVPEGLKGQRR